MQYQSKLVRLDKYGWLPRQEKTRVILKLLHIKKLEVRLNSKNVFYQSFIFEKKGDNIMNRYQHTFLHIISANNTN